MATLSDLITRHPGFTDGRLLLAEIYVHQGDLPRAETAPTVQLENLSPRDRIRLASALQKLNPAPH